MVLAKVVSNNIKLTLGHDTAWMTSKLKYRAFYMPSLLWLVQELNTGVESHANIQWLPMELI